MKKNPVCSGRVSCEQGREQEVGVKEKKKDGSKEERELDKAKSKESKEKKEKKEKKVREQ